MGMNYDVGKYRLAEISSGDAQEVFERFTGNAKNVRYLPYKRHDSVQETNAMILGFAFLARDGVRVLTVRKDGLLVGIISGAKHGHSVGIAINIAIDRHSIGAGREVSENIVRAWLTQPDVYRVWAYTDVDNKRAINLLENIGAECEGRMRRYEIHPNISDEPRDCYLYAITR